MKVTLDIDDEDEGLLMEGVVDALAEKLVHHVPDAVSEQVRLKVDGAISAAVERQLDVLSKYSEELIKHYLASDSGGITVGERIVKEAVDKRINDTAIKMALDGHEG